MKTPESYIVLAIILELYFLHSDTSAVITTIGSLRENVDFECGTDIVIICSTQPNPLEVVWKIDNVRVADCTFGVCSNDMSLPALYTFSDNVTEGLFHINIQPVSFLQNGKTFSCEEGSTSVDNLTAEVNVLPDNASFSVDVTSDTQIIVTTGCVYPETEVTIEWYIYKAGMDAVQFTQHKPVRTANSTGCSSGNCGNAEAARVSSTLIIPTIESGDLYNFQIMVIHSSTRKVAVVETIKKYRLNVSDNPDGPTNNGMTLLIIGLSIGILTLLLGILLVVYKLDKPKRITSFTVNELTDTSVNVAWETNTSRICQTNYILKCCLPDGQVVSTAQLQYNGKDTMTYRFDNLSALTTYHLYLQAEGKILKTKCQKPVQFTTYGKPDTPTDFKIADNSITKSSIAVQWKRGDNCGCQQSFILTYSNNPSKMQQKVIPDDQGKEIMKHIFKNLHERTTYSFTIYSKNQIGDSDKVGPIHGMTKGTGKLDQPKGFCLVQNGTTETSIAVQWKPGQNGGLPQEFILTCSEKGQNTVDSIKVVDDGKNDIMRYVFVNLKKAMYYKLTICATNRAGQSPSDELLVRTNGWPDPPTEICIVHESATKTTVDVEWTRGLDGGFPQRFILKIFEDDGKLHSEEYVEDVHDADYITHTIKHLSEFTTYQLELLSQNKKGNSKQLQKCFKHLYQRIPLNL